MINLVRNELTKIFSKKAIYIYTAIILSLVVGVCIISNKLSNSDTNGISNSYLEALEEGLDSYNLEDEMELRWYIGDKVIVEAGKLSQKYKADSPERYFIDDVIEPLYQEKYQKQYFYKDIEGANNVQIEIDKVIAFLDNFDWKKQILDEKKVINDSIKEIETLLLEDKDNEDLKKSLEALKLELWILDYRLDNKIPYSYSSESSLLDYYKELSNQYVNLKDEKLIQNKEELNRVRKTKAEYATVLYKLENNLVNEKQETIDYIIMCMSSIDGFIVIALIIICGTIISEEFNKGTIKQLLTKPFSRSKILTSKIIACLIAFTLFILLYQTVFVLANCWETNSLSNILGTNVVYDYGAGVAREVSVLGQIIYAFLSTLPAYIIMFLLIIFIGTLTTNSVATTVIGFASFIGGDLVTLWVSEKVQSFIPLCVWNLSPFMYGGVHDNVYITFGKSLVIDIFTIVLLTVLSYVVFKKKEIKNQ